MSTTILVIDDSADDQLLYERALRDAGYTLEMASTAEAAFAHLQKARPGLILLDYNLPDDDGLSLISKLKQQLDHNVPIIMLTGENLAAIAVEAMKQGADDYLVKDTEGRYLRRLPDLVRHTIESNEHREQAQLLRQETERLLRRNQILMQNSMDAIYVMDMQGNIVEANHAFSQMLGYAPEEALRLNVIDWDAQWTKEELEERFRSLLGRSARFETVHRRKDGTLINVEVSASGVDIEGQRFMFASSRDITERKHAEKRIAYSESIYHGLFESMSSGVAVYAPVDDGKDFVFMDFNRTAERLENIKREEVIGKRLTECFPGVEEFGLFAVLQRVCQSGKPEYFPASFYQDGRIAGWRENHVYRLPSGEVVAVYDDVTARKQNEAVLQRYKQVIDTSIDGFWVTDMQGNLLDANAAYAQMSGYTVDELKKMNVGQLDAIDTPEIIAERGRKIARFGQDRFETKHRRKDGKLLDIEVSIAYMPETQQCFVFSRDITARKRAEEVIARSEANLHAILDNSPYLTWLKDREGRYITVNKVFADYLHLDAPRLAEGKTDLDLQPSELAEKYRADDEEVMASRQRKHVEEKAFDGRQIHWVETWKTPILSEHGEVLGTVGFAADITDRKKAEEEMRIAAVAFETHDAIVITDVNANIVRVNQAFTDITGYAQDEVQGKNPRIMSSGRQDRMFYVEMWQQLLHTGSWAGEIWDKRKNGQVYPKWMTITAVRNELRETTHYVAIFSDITARKQAEEEIRNLAFYDALTRLPNRRLFMDRFRAALTISARRNDYGAVLFIDLDRFKNLNDTLGHDYGDMLLVEVSARIKSCVREMDTVARLGGDEFVVLLEGISSDTDEASRNAGLIAEKIRDALSCPYKLRSHEHHSSPSIGISLYRGHEATVDELLQQADMAMYQAKGAGRNAVRFFDPVMQHNVETRAELENDLHHAIALNQFHLYYQIQVDDSNRPLGAEALLRWLHPQRGMVQPGQFIPIAEDSTLILKIGHWVLEQACQQLAAWARNESMQNLSLAINVSAKQFAQPNFVDEVEACLKLYGVTPSRLKLELTESLVLDELQNTVSKMHALKELGVKLSLDDFGTGYSSLSYLKQLPLDQLKIDRSFVHGITQDGNDALLVQTIIDLAENFHLGIIAEGVETEGQLTFLRANGCSIFQGFLFGRPVPAGEFEKAVISM